MDIRYSCSYIPLLVLFFCLSLFTRAQDCPSNSYWKDTQYVGFDEGGNEIYESQCHNGIISSSGQCCSCSDRSSLVSSCVAERNGYISGCSAAEGDYVCLDCPSGFFCENAVKNPCPEGFYCRGDSRKVYCENSAGEWCEEEGMIVPRSRCPPGHFWDLSGCKPAWAGSYFNSSQYLDFDRSVRQWPMECANGFYQPDPGQSSCFMCASGKFSKVTIMMINEDGNSDYALIDGVFVDRRRQFQLKKSCDFCALGTTSEVGICKGCPAGTHGYRSGFCEPCQKGKYQDLIGQVECKRCVGRQFSEYEYAPSCQECPVVPNANNQKVIYEITGDDIIGKEIHDKNECRFCPPKHYSCKCYYLQNFSSEADFEACLRENDCFYPATIVTMLTGKLIGKPCLPCPPGYVCLPGQYNISLRRQPVLGVTYQVEGKEDSDGDNVLLPCTNCTASEYMVQECGLLSDRVCKKCTVPTKWVTYPAIPCSQTQDTVLEFCDYALNHTKPGGVCNLCPPGTKPHSILVGNCEKCPENFYGTGAACFPCSGGSNEVSAEGSSQCSVKCSNVIAYGQTVCTDPSCNTSPTGLVQDCQYLNENATRLVTVADVKIPMAPQLWTRVPGGDLLVVGTNFVGRGGLLMLVDPSKFVDQTQQHTFVHDYVNNEAVFGGISKLGTVESILHAHNTLFVLSSKDDEHGMIWKASYDAARKNYADLQVLYRSVGPTVFSSIDAISATDYLVCTNSIEDKSLYRLSIASAGTSSLATIRSGLYGPSKVLVRGNQALIFDRYVIRLIDFGLDGTGGDFTVCGRGASHKVLYQKFIFNQSGTVTCRQTWIDSQKMRSDIAWPSLDLVFYMIRYGLSMKMFRIDIIEEWYGKESYIKEIQSPKSSYPLSIDIGLLTDTTSDKLFIVETNVDLSGMKMLEMATAKYLCNAGLYFSQAVMQCVQTPVGTYAPRWSRKPITCPINTYTVGSGGMGPEACVPCPLLNGSGVQLGTNIAGALFCHEMCPRGTPLNPDMVTCGEPCDPSRGNFFNGSGCVSCPLGTHVIDSEAYELVTACGKCSAGTYASSPGICTACPSGKTTAYDGSFYCSPVSTPLACGLDGLYGLGETCAARKTLVSHLNEKSSIKVLSDGVLLVGNGTEVLKHEILDKETGRGNWTRLASVEQQHSNASLVFVRVNIETPFELVEGSNDGTLLFFTQYNSHCVWYSDNLDSGSQVHERDGAWAGKCGDGSYEMNGNRHVARFGYIQDMAYVEVQGRPPLLLLSTVTRDNCASIRSISMYDGSVSTLYSIDYLLFPTILSTVCNNGFAFKLGSAKGSEVVYFSRGVHIEKVNIYTTSYYAEKMALSLADGVRPLAMCGLSNRLFMFVTSSAPNTAQVWNLQSAELMSPLSLTNFSHGLQCMGQHVWYVSSSDLTGHGEVQELSRSILDSKIECIGGHAQLAEHPTVCHPAGIGTFKDFESEEVSFCPAGTFNLKTGSADRLSCLSCGERKVSTEGAFTCVECRDPQNSFVVDGKQCLNSCSRGYYVDSQQRCVACPPGKTTRSENTVGIDQCVACSENEYSNALTNYTCLACPAGKVSKEGSAMCVIACGPNQCSTNGIVCQNVAVNFEVITSLSSPERIQALIAVNGQGILYTNGDNLGFFKDVCPSYLSHVDAQTCVLELFELAPPCVDTCAGVGRSLFSMAMSPFVEVPLSAISSQVKFLYTSSKITNKIYRLPITFKNGEVDVLSTQSMLAQNESGRTGLEQWAIAGNGVAGFRDGPASEAMFSLVADLEVSSDDAYLYISDFRNHRIRVLHIPSMTVTTVVGNGVSCWNAGFLGPHPPDIDTSVCSQYNRYSLASKPNGIELDVSTNDLYLAMQDYSKVGRLNYVRYLNDRTQKLEYFCEMNTGDNVLPNNPPMTCKKNPRLTGHRSCFLNRVYDLAVYNDFIIAAVIDGIMVIDKQNLTCSRIAGVDWKYGAEATGFEDGENGTSRFNLPFRLSVSRERGILYIIDYGNKAIRRIYFNGKCTCPQGTVYVESGKSCYNPGVSVTDKKLKSCQQGFFALENENVCRDCSQASALNLNVPQCVLWANFKLMLNSRFPFAQINDNPVQKIGLAADYFGGPTRPDRVGWDAIFAPNQAVGYRLGRQEGHAPSGSQFFSIAYNLQLQKWLVVNAPEMRPTTMIPGFWYPCNTHRLDWGNPVQVCSCPWQIGEFDSPANVVCDRPTWNCLRRAAVERGGRTFAGTDTVMEDMVKAAAWTWTFGSWSRYVLLGSENAPCVDGGQGPCFPYFWHEKRAAPSVLPVGGGTSPPAGFRDTVMFVETSSLNLAVSADLKCGTGWPMHAYCPNGFMWVGAHNSSQVQHLELGQRHAVVVACVSCLPGTFSSESLETRKVRGGPYKCQKCGLGTYSDSVGATACAACPPNTYASQFFGSTGCVQCPLHHYSVEKSSSDQSCTACVPGTGKCEDCPAGTYQSRAAQPICLTCPKGYYSSVKGSSDCQPCPLDTFQDVVGGQGCEPCPAGTFTFSEGSWNCSTCPPDPICPLFVGRRCGTGCGRNHYWSIDEARCVRCPSNSINAKMSCAMSVVSCYTETDGSEFIVAFDLPENGGDVVQTCPVGRRASANFLGCEPCPAGTYGLENGGCRACPPGSFSLGGSAANCSACPAGSYAAESGQSRCDFCATGAFSIGNGNTNCTACPAGTFADEVGLSQCKNCLNGTFSAVIGRTDDCVETCDASSGLYSGLGASICKQCTIGVVSLKECVGCGLGMYFEDSQCKVCPVGTFNNHTQEGVGLEATCKSCAATEYTPLAVNGTRCVKAQAGYQVLVSNKEVEVPCARGFFRRGDDTMVACAACEPGKFAGQQASAACEACLPGRSQALSGQVACSPCGTGRFSSEFGVLQCGLCGNGSIPTADKTRCELCPRNKYKAQLASCGSCPSGTISPEGSSRSQDCRPCEGNYVFMNGTCSLCPPGTFKKKTGMDVVNNLEVFQCESCPAGTHNPNKGAGDASNCTSCLGYGYVPSANKSACERCAPGQQGSGGIQCLDCPAGSFSADGGMCVDCEPGTFNPLPRKDKCEACAPGSFSQHSKSTQCQLCPIGTFESRNGSVECARCVSSRGFSDRMGLVDCIPRKTTCQEGQYMKLNFELADRDHDCAACSFCRANQFTVVNSRFMDLGASLGEDFLTTYCPGNSTKPLYSCIDNAVEAGMRLYVDGGGAAGSGSDPTGTVGTQVGMVPCTEIQNAGNALLHEYVGYVVGSLGTQCYVGCKFGLNEAGLRAYQTKYPFSSGESPANNIFFTRMLDDALSVCDRCPLTPCPLGLYRPQYGNVNCGPPCLLLSASECFLDRIGGCIRPCTDQPLHSVMIGGSNILNNPTCEWQCQVSYFKNDNNTKCLSCANETFCEQGYIAVDVAECMPNHHRSDLCKLCDVVEGGQAVSWNRVKGKCVYRCSSGYYAVDEGTMCLPCVTNLSLQRCPVGQFRDTAQCFEAGTEPICRPCYLAQGASESQQRKLLSFHTDGGYSGAECVATCKAGYNAYFASQPSQLVPVRTVRTYSVNISCRVCDLDSSVPCQGQCPGGKYRNNSASDTSENGCVTCRNTMSCERGFYAEECDGNGTSDARCLPCDKSVLLDSETNIEVRVFLPNESPTYGQCPTACGVNHIRHNNKCMTCYQYVREVKNCFAETRTSTFYTSGQPFPCDFVYSHWNATPGEVWWEPQYTPSFLRAFVDPASRANARRSICWACPAGRGTFKGDGDLCEVLPGYGKPLNVVERKVQLTVQSNLLNLMTLDVKRSRPARAGRRLLTLSGRSGASVTAAGESAALVAAVGGVQKCPFGYFKSDRNLAECVACPSGTSTFEEGSTSISACKCLYGHRRMLESAAFGLANNNATYVSEAVLRQLNSTLLYSLPCVPCDAGTYRPISMTDETKCLKCGPDETTYGKENATSCGCKFGMLRKSKGSCEPCPANFFCVPCFDDDNGCPVENSYVESCFPNATSPAGSFSVQNCTCHPGTYALKRDYRWAPSGISESIENERRLKANLYCLGGPPFSEYDKVSKKLVCKRGWISKFDEQIPERLVGCFLCEPGSYSVRDPSVPIYRDGILQYLPLECVPCPIGTFSSSSTMIGQCKKCPYEFTTSKVGSRDSADCGCPPYKRLGQNKTECVGCNANEYFSNQTCVPCPAHSILDPKIEMPSLLQHCLCERGYEMTPSGLCRACEIGLYSGFSSNAQCRRCPVGSTTLQPGSTSVYDCIVCLEGYKLIPETRKCINNSISVF